jgi:outer membrane protein assembly factor BamB
MKILWETQMPDADFGYSNYCCKPIIWKSRLFYAFDKVDKENLSGSRFYGTKIYVLQFNLATGIINSKFLSLDYEFNWSDPKERKIALTNNWNFIVKDNKVFLYVGFLIEINAQSINIFDIDFRLKPKRIESRYLFNEKLLNYNQFSTIDCYNKETNCKLWKIKIKGYLYTNLEYKDNLIFFGTAGKGGAFYCVNLDNGNILTEYSNTDASNYEWINNYVLIRDVKGNLIKIDPLNNKVIETVLLNDKIFQAPILFAGNLIFTTVHNRRKNFTKLICVQP